MIRHASVRAAEPEDAQAIVSVFREAVQEAIVPLVILGTRHADAYVAACIRATPFGGDTAHWVAVAPSGDVIGFIQLRLGFRSVVVNQLHVRPEDQRRGVGRLLLLAALEATGARDHERDVLVDAFEENRQAHGFYRRLGFTVERRTHWRVIRIPAHVPAPYVVRNKPQADAAHAALGVSMFQVETEHGSYDVGRLGDAWYRLPHAAVDDQGLLSALQMIDADRQLLTMTPAELDAHHERPHLTAVRYVTTGSALIARLER